MFRTNEDGRGKKPRSTFFGYVAVSQPPAGNNGVDKAAPTPASNATTEEGEKGKKQGQDVALVWRGTIFREEWESNFSQDELVSVCAAQHVQALTAGTVGDCGVPIMFHCTMQQYTTQQYTMHAA